MAGWAGCYAVETVGNLMVIRFWRPPAFATALLLSTLWVLAAGSSKQPPYTAVRSASKRSITIRTDQGTGLSFDITPDGRRIIFDLMGQLWSVSVDGGDASPLTDAVRDTSDDADPAVAPDGAWVVFRSDRPQGRGIWLRALHTGVTVHSR